MKKTPDILIACLLSSGFIIFLFVLGTHQGLSFDASYNLLSYQNFFEGKGFICDYDGRYVPFDPTINTGPELYLPVFVIWKLIGRADYYVSAYVIIAYYALFLGFLLFYVLTSSNTKTVSVIAFAFLFLSNKNFFTNFFPVIPLGEFVSCLYAFAGIYLLSRRKLLVGFALLGLALDAKPSTIVALIPTTMIFSLLEFILPRLKERKLNEAFKVTLTLIMFSSLIFVPYITYSKIIPSLVLNSQEKHILKIAQKDRREFLKNTGCGQIKLLGKNFNREGFKQFILQVQKKFITFKSWYDNSYLLVALLGIVFFVLIIFSYYQKHFSFYLFIFSVFIAIWWFLGPVYSWYRHFVPAEFMFSLGIVALVPTLMKKGQRVVSICTSLAIIMLFVPQFSLSAITQNLDDADKQNLMMMKNHIQKIDEQNIFTYGWFQCPQLMLLTNKRFQDYTNREKVSTAWRERREIFLLTTVENFQHIRGEMEGVTEHLELVKEYGYNRLYRIHNE